ncbi:MAG: hypothetical protein ACK5LR_06945 [Mangrovibacterium sp.]
MESILIFIFKCITGFIYIGFIILPIYVVVSFISAAYKDFKRKSSHTTTEKSNEQIS